MACWRRRLSESPLSSSWLRSFLHSTFPTSELAQLPLDGTRRRTEIRARTSRRVTDTATTMTVISHADRSCSANGVP
eukprot:6372200-Amphidinium_carterae.1